MDIDTADQDLTEEDTIIRRVAVSKLMTEVMRSVGRGDIVSLYVKAQAPLS